MRKLIDAVHPSLIPMDVPTSPSTPLGPMTRARAKAIEDKVNSLLSELPIPTHETWLLPHSETLCVIRCLETSHGAATPKSQDGEAPNQDEQEEELPRSYRRRTTDNVRTSDKSQDTDDRTPPDVRHFVTQTKSTDVRSGPDGGRQAPEPKLRTSERARTTGPS